MAICEYPSLSILILSTMCRKSYDPVKLARSAKSATTLDTHQGLDQSASTPPPLLIKRFQLEAIMKNLFMDKYASSISYFWGLTCAAIGALSLNDVALIIGIIVSIATFFYNIYHKRQIRKMLKNKKWINHEKVD